MQSKIERVSKEEGYMEGREEEGQPVSLMNGGCSSTYQLPYLSSAGATCVRSWYVEGVVDRKMPEEAKREANDV